MKLFLPLLAMQLATAGAYDANECDRQFIRKEKFEIRVSSDCRVDVFPRDGGTRQRSFSFYPNGFLMAFIDTQDYATNSRSTGSRTFYLFPVSARKPVVRETGAGGFEILTASGTHVTVGPDGTMETVNGGKVILGPLKHMDQIAKARGGIELSGAKGVVVDHGWATGGIAYRHFDRSSVIQDQRGHTCMVKNGEMYSRNKEDPSDPLKKFHSPGEWKAFITKRCGNLKWSDEPYKSTLTVQKSSSDSMGDFIRRLESEDAR